jgi:hypothetical protein
MAVEAFVGKPMGFFGSIAVLCCFAVAVAAGAAVCSLGIDDAVDATGKGPLDLTGVPGERIRLHLMTGERRYLSSDMSVRLEDAQTSAVVAAERVEVKEEGDRVLARFSVPDVGGGKTADLVGTIYGQVGFDALPGESIEIPFKLAVRPSGEVVTSGGKDAPLASDLATLLGFIVFALALAVPSAVSWLSEVYARKKEARALTRHILLSGK